MLITGHQPNYLPYIGFFHKVLLADVFVIVDLVQYVKRGPFGWINRNRIRTDQGWIWLTVPVKTKGKYHQSIMETGIDNSTSWARKHLKSIERNYHSAPYFQRYFKAIQQIYLKQWLLLAELNEAIIRYLIDALGIKVKIVRASQLGLDYKLPDADTRNDGSATDLIIQICQKLGSDSYLHGKHGQDYLDESMLKESKIVSCFQEFHHPVYKQQYQSFMPEMSVIDLLFNHGDESMKIISQSGKYICK
ncbi:MAG: WbqC family protein [Planctomycetes bacterium]|nr:WbqC family protein [Planctomycetota bacterium]